MQKYLIWPVLLLIIGFFVAMIYLPVSSSAKGEVIFNIEKGEGSRDISLHLEKEGLIMWAPIFRLYVLTVGISGRLQAGNYVLSPSMNLPQIADKFFKGESIKEKITIIEGWNLRDVGFYFENRGMFQAEELWEAAGFPAIDYSGTNDLPFPLDFSSEYDFLKDKPKTLGLEGYLFPDTYEIEDKETIKGIIRKMLDNFDKKLTFDLREEIKKQKKTVFEIITMASLIEREVKTNEDKRLVSGILWKRLNLGMPLQVDATIIFITGKRDKSVSIEETKIDSPYNTYKYRGLPLGPISNPGLESILAAVYPEDSPNFYYLSAPGGKTIFSITLKKHNSAKAEYLKP